MNKIHILFLSVFTLLATPVNADTRFEHLYSRGKINIVLSTNGLPTKEQVTKQGKSACDNERICVIWYFYDQKKAERGIELLKIPDFFKPIPGLIAIYIKNNIVNHVGCYEPKGTC